MRFLCDQIFDPFLPVTLELDYDKELKAFRFYAAEGVPIPQVVPKFLLPYCENGPPFRFDLIKSGEILMSIIPEKLRETADSAVSVILKGQRQRIQKQQRQQRIQKNQQKQPEDPNQAYLMGVLQGRVPKDPKTSLVALLRYFGYDAIMDAGMVFMNKKPNTIYLDRGIEQFCFSEHTYFKKIGQKYRPMYLVNNFDEALQHYGNLFLKAKSG